MLRAVAAFELRQQWRGHVFWVVLAISAVMVIGSVGVDELRVGLDGGGLRNGTEAVVRTHLVWTLFFLFTTAAFVADAVLRDDLTGFAPIVRATPLRRRDYLLGRFAGATAAVLLCYASVPLGLLAGAQMPWVAPATVGPLRPTDYAFALLVMAVPNLLLSSAVGFGLATATRSMGGALIGAIVLLVGYGLGARADTTLPAVVEPFGFAAYARATAGWSRSALDTQLPALSGVLLVNRLLVLASAAALMLVAARRLGARARAAPRADRLADASARWPATPRPIAPRFDRWTTARQFAARTRLEVGQGLRSSVFAALMILALANALATLWPLAPSGDADAVVRAVADAFALVPIVVALFFAGELRWNERQHRIDRILGATPLARAAFLPPKLLALALVLIVIAAGAALAAAGTLVVAGGGPGHGGHLAAWFWSACYDWLLFAVLAMFLQAIAPGKLAGWGFTVLFLIGSLALERLGFVDPWYRYGRYPGSPLPELVSGATGSWPYRLWWAAVAALLVALSVRVARPGRDG